MFMLRLSYLFAARIDIIMAKPSMADGGIDCCDSPATCGFLPRPSIVNGRYEIPWSGFTLPGAVGLMKFMATSTDESNIPSQQTLDETLPVMPWDVDATARPPAEGVTVTWIGHSTLLVQMDNVSILTDPVFSECCGPVRLPGVPLRYRRAACTVDQLPHIDAVIISHNHFDHLDYTSVVQLNRRFGSRLRWYVPSGLRTWMQSSGCQSVTELSWWQEETNSEGIRFACVPAQHWSKRGVWDDNKTLWGGWCVIGPRHRFYFAGDTGYNETLFRHIRSHYGPFHLAALPIGAYSPRWFMKCQHVDPAEAWKVHEDIGAFNSIGVHWGTFKLSNEFYLEPRDCIKKWQDQHEKREGCRGFFTTNIGESVQLMAD